MGYARGAWFIFTPTTSALPSKTFQAESLLQFLREPAVHRFVVQWDLAALVLFDGIYDAGVEGPRIEVKADCPLAELPQIADIVDRVERVDRDRMIRTDLHHVGGNDIAAVTREVLVKDA